MKCFLHPHEDSFGICKHCGKGLCPSCAKEVKGGLACANTTCESMVSSVHELVCENLSAREINQQRAGKYFQSAFLSVLGLCFLAAPWLTGESYEAASSKFPLVTGGALLAFGVISSLYQVAWQRKLKRQT